MDLAHFWTLIDAVHSGSRGQMQRKCELLRDALSKLSSEEVLSFMGHFDARMDAAYSWELWGAAYVIGGGCGDDMFMDFRSTLISCGRVLFERTIKAPDTLADAALTQEVFYEGFSYVALKLYRDRTGKIPVRKGAQPSEPSGLEWREEDLPLKFPKLSAKYGWDGIRRE